MNEPTHETNTMAGLNGRYSSAEQAERLALGLPTTEPALPGSLPRPQRETVKTRAIKAGGVLNEADDYFPIASAFSRGLRVDLGCGTSHLLISGTSSVGTEGETLYAGDFRAQLWRTYHNITKLLEAEGATWHDIVRTTCYLRDIERDYDEFNQIRNEFFLALGLDPLPASTGIQARICRSDLLIEIEAHAILERGSCKA